MKAKALVALIVASMLTVISQPIARAEGGGGTGGGNGGTCEEDTVAVRPGRSLVEVDLSKTILLNGLLSSLLGAKVELGVGDYGPLVGADVELGVLLEKLGHSEGCRWDEAFCKEISIHALLVALAEIALEKGHHHQKDSLLALAALVVHLDVKVRLCDFIHVDHPGGIGAVAHLRVDVFGLLISCLSHHRHAHPIGPIFVDLDGGLLVGADLLGLVRLKIEILRPAKIVLGHVGTRFEATAARIWLEIAPKDGNLALDVEALGIASAHVELAAIPIVVELGAAAGVVSCIDAHSGSVSVDASAGVSACVIGNVDVEAAAALGLEHGVSPCKLGKLSIASILGVSASADLSLEAKAALGAAAEASLDFCGPYPEGQQIEASLTGSLALLAALHVNLSIEELEVQLLGLGVQLSAEDLVKLHAIVKARIDVLVLAVAGQAISHIVDPIAAILGISVGHSEVNVLSVGHGQTPDACEEFGKSGDGVPPECCVPSPCSDVCGDGHDWGVHSDGRYDAPASESSDGGKHHGGLCSAGFADTAASPFLAVMMLLLGAMVVRRRRPQQRRA